MQTVKTASHSVSHYQHINVVINITPPYDLWKIFRNTSYIDPIQKKKRLKTVTQHKILYKALLIADPQTQIMPFKSQYKQKHKPQTTSQSIPTTRRDMKQTVGWKVNLTRSQPLGSFETKIEF